MKNKMIGYFGGSFDPVHYGHLLSASSIKQELSLKKIYLMPCNPVHKKSLYFSSKQRIEMLNLALNEFPDLSLSTIEIEQNKPTYTVDTLKKIKQKYPYEKIFFIMGQDSFETINTWKDYKTLSNYAQLVVLPRKTYICKKATNIYFAKTPLVNISSTRIRDKISTKQNLSNLTPNTVIDYIKNIK